MGLVLSKKISAGTLPRRAKQGPLLEPPRGRPTRFTQVPRPNLGRGGAGARPGAQSPVPSLGGRSGRRSRGPRYRAHRGVSRASLAVQLAPHPGRLRSPTFQMRKRGHQDVPCPQSSGRLRGRASGTPVHVRVWFLARLHREF